MPNGDRTEIPDFRTFVELARLLLSHSRDRHDAGHEERRGPMRNFVTSLMFAGASLLGTVGIVTYADPAVAQTTIVHHSNAELASPEGRSEIAKRIRFAASHVCATSEAGQSFAEANCKAQAAASAEAELSAR
jgi:UrcA family protein